MVDYEPVIDDEGAILGDVGNGRRVRLFLDSLEERAELVVLVAACDDKARARLGHGGEDSGKALTVIFPELV